MIVAEEPAEPSSTSDVSVGRPKRFRCEELIVKSLVVALAVVMRDELCESPAQVGVAERHDTVQAFLLN